MSEDRLDRALSEMRDEHVDAGTLEAARARVWEKLASPGSAACAEFGQDFDAYLRRDLSNGRRLLLEDHLSRCAACRARLAEMKGARKVVAMPRRTPSRWRSWTAVAAAAAVILAVLYLGRHAIDDALGPGGPRATLVAARGDLFRLPVGALGTGAAIAERETVRTGPGGHAILRLADGSLVEVNERTELFLTAAWSGQAIHLQRGDIIVKAAAQRRGSLRVLTRTSTATVKGTVFAVSAGMGGSVVSVVEGSVAVNQRGGSLILRPGQQAATLPSLVTSVPEAVSWSPDAASYIELLASLVTIERELARVPTELRTSSSLLQYLPSGAFVFGAIPNPGLTIGVALGLAEEQSAQNGAFGAWWRSDAGQGLKAILNRIHSVNGMLGDEIVFSASFPGRAQPVPMVMAQVKPGSRNALESALSELFASTEGAEAAFSVSDDLLVVSDSPSNLAWALAHIGQGAGSPFAAAIAGRYARGVGWLFAMDAPPLVEMASEDDAPPIEFADMMGMKYVFVEQRAPAGAIENEITLAFEGQRTGMGAWLADAGSGGAAEYLPPDALAAGYVSTREPLQLFEELTARLAPEAPDFQRGLAEADEKLGAGFLRNLSAAVGAETAVAVTGMTVAGPSWVMATVANDPATIDSSLRTLMDAINAELGPDEQDKRVTLEQTSDGGRTWTTIRPGALPFGITWTYDRGYLVAASDRGMAERAIATRNGGSPLVWSPEFLAQIPASAGLHPSGFWWLNAKGALDLLSALNPNPALRELVASRDPILVVFNGTPDQIHAASRTRLSGVIMDLLLLGSLGHAAAAPAAGVTSP